MMKRLKKIWRYILNYNRNKILLRLLEDKNTTPFYLRHLRLSIQNTYDKQDTAEKMLANMVISYHSIEKGLAMSQKRLGFGQPKMRELIKLCNHYMDMYTDYSSRLIDTLGVIAEYDQLHKEQKYNLQPDLQEKIDTILKRTKGHWIISHTCHVSRDDYFAAVEKKFAEFSASRHSIRDFDGTKIEKEVMEKVFTMAQNAPSACNRQSTRVYAVYDEKKRAQLVELQNHERGFADNANPLLVIATEMQCWQAGEQWFGGYLDAGIYIMNLLYALHYYKVAAIPLNWYADVESQQKIHQILSMPESHEVVAFVACGSPMCEFNLVTSRRRYSEEIVSYQ